MRHRRVAILAVVSTVVVVVGAVGVLGVSAGLDAYRASSRARAATVAAERALRTGDREQAFAALDRAEAEAGRASAALARPAPQLIAAVPLLGRSVRAAAALSDAAAVGADGARLTVDLIPERSPWRDGRVDLDALQRMRAEAAEAEAVLEEALGIADRAPGWPLPGPLADVRERLRDRLRQTRDTVRRAEDALEVLPHVLGGADARRYFLVAQNPSENRGTGGFWGSSAFLEAEGGVLSLGGFGRPVHEIPTETIPPYDGPDWYMDRYARWGGPMEWRQVNAAPDFPTVAELAERNIERSPAVDPVDGVIAFDPAGLAAMMRLTGPVEVEGWPEPIGADNVVRVTLYDAYREFDGETLERFDFLGAVAHQVWLALVQDDVDLQPGALAEVGKAIRARNLQFHLVRPEEQGMLERAGAAGAFQPHGAGLAVVTQNAAANKIDHWLTRGLSATWRLREDGSAELDISASLRNDAPTTGEPSYLIGPNRERFLAGENVQYVSVYVPPGAELVADAEAGGEVGTELGAEPGFTVISRFVSIPAGEERVLSWRFRVPDAWDPEAGRMAWSILHQPSLRPDDVAVRIEAPSGWEIDHALGLDLDDGAAVLEGEVATDREGEVVLSRTVLGSLWELVS